MIKFSLIFSFLILGFVSLYLLSDATARRIGDCSSGEVRELKAEGWTLAEIRELCTPQQMPPPQRPPAQVPQAQPAFRCACFEGPTCPLNLSGPLPQGAPCFCNFGFYGSCQGITY